MTRVYGWKPGSKNARSELSRFKGKLRVIQRQLLAEAEAEDAEDAEDEAEDEDAEEEREDVGVTMAGGKKGKIQNQGKENRNVMSA